MKTSIISFLRLSWVFAFCFCFTSLSIHAEEYWIPYVDETPAPNVRLSRVIMTTAQNAFVDLDFDHDGVIDETHALFLGDQLVVELPKLKEGTHIVSSVPLSVHYQYQMGDFNAYEDGRLYYEIPAISDLGKDYWLPATSSELVFLSISDGTQIDFDGNSLSLDRGDVLHYPNPAAGMHITGSQKFMVLAVNYEAARYDQTFAYTLFPVGHWGQSYFVAKEHPYALNNSISSSKVIVIASERETQVSVNGASVVLNEGEIYTHVTTQETLIESTRPVSVLYVSDVEGTDPWASVNRRYMTAHLILPASLSGKEYVLGRGFNPIPNQGAPVIQVAIVSLEDGNQLKYDVGNDGTTEQSFVLNRGVYAYIHEGDVPQWDEQSVLALSGTHVFTVTYSLRGWWAQTSEATGSMSVLPLSGQVSTAIDPLDEGISILKNFPNPFSVYTFINFHQSLPGEVLLSVTDLQGKQIDQQIWKFGSPGKHQIKYEGDHLSPGVYLFRLSTSDQVYAGRLLIDR